MSDVLVSAQGLGKTYPRSHRSSDRLRALARLLLNRVDHDAHRVLHDISLEIRRGESVGIIGENGAGKSTLLKLITGVLTPTTGSVAVHGSIGALLELGAGFNPEYTGRENVAMAAALRGLSGRALSERMPSIIEFADIGDYIDEPVKHYSSGMVVRLGFAVVAALRPDLLITDEVLAVGDESFQRKCVRWMEDYLEGGGTLLLVSHSMYHVQKLCRRALWLRDGAVAAFGDVFDVTQAYLAWHEARSVQRESMADRAGIELSVGQLALNGIQGESAPVLDFGASLHVQATIESRDGRVPVVLVGVVRADGTPVYGVSTEMERRVAIADADGRYCADIQFDTLPLLPGSYSIRVHALDPEGVRLFDTRERGFVVRGESREFGLVRLPHRWGGVREIEP
ncbi:MAG TPA: ABC transporter ATP-binding protein [Dokdonella sp.]|uniref:ABC transporter ATP-binding protein n=1 Tax=Dokdonella sp. TaxID=2291710 RepID=UPI0025BF5CBA|nr:ABC transporter ATP-binding protein [Dokdonella sp.]MBX3690799.1 ABC transporter ATP-binding protein [Dokdonella sp.]MCW5566615.1 ABC transporter ATP-binding protein [Dokdonella sp.]HNR91674.1 ABC transporter ATP-binding protein [Dokdonella sp.]